MSEAAQLHESRASARARLYRYAASMAFALAFAGLASLTQLYARAELGLRDLQMRFLSPPLPVVSRARPVD